MIVSKLQKADRLRAGGGERYKRDAFYIFSAVLLMMPGFWLFGDIKIYGSANSHN